MLALAGAVAAVVLTTHLHTAAMNLSAAFESIRVAEKLELNLLALDTIEEGRLEADPALISRIELAIRDGLVQVARFTESDEEAALARDAGVYVNDYLGQLDPLADPGHTISRRAALRSAVAKLDELVQVNVEQGHAARAEAARWDQLANGGAVGGALFLVGTTAALLVWIRKLFLPVFDIGRAMDQFGAGDRQARAPLQGPRELCEIAQRFNLMADAIVRQRTAATATLAGVAHDLRNPLSALKLATASAMRMPHTNDDGGRLRHTLEVVARQVGRLERMTSDLLDSARIESGQVELRLEECDAVAIARDVIDLYGTLADGHRVHLKAPTHPVSIRCDPQRIEQVLNNLVSNALKYSPPGEAVELSVEGNRDGVVISVSDHGVGIAPEDQANVFAPFRRVGSSADSVPGAGLGLSVVQRIVEAHGGRVQLESAVGRGSKFSVELPAMMITARSSYSGVRGETPSQHEKDHHARH